MGCWAHAATGYLLGTCSNQWPAAHMQAILLNLAWAGHDTTATALTSALWLLPQHHAVLARLRAEQQAVVAQHGEAITEAVLKESPYLDAVVKELLRHQVGVGGGGGDSCCARLLLRLHVSGGVCCAGLCCFCACRLLCPHATTSWLLTSSDMYLASCDQAVVPLVQAVVGSARRRALQDFRLGQYVVKRGDRLQLSLAQMMERDPRWAHLPADSPLAVAKFAPERWLEGEGAEGRTGGWLPFGAGARMCLGYPLALAEIKVGGWADCARLALQVAISIHAAPALCRCPWQLLQHSHLHTAMALLSAAHASLLADLQAGVHDRCMCCACPAAGPGAAGPPCRLAGVRPRRGVG
jgi:hypothetical protein